ncbi:MAG: ParB/RepB/Spo0J family partition protein [Bacillota bacterium]|jgi:ParB family chromosome partitioning protein
MIKESEEFTMAKKGLGSGLGALFGDAKPVLEDSITLEKVQLLKVSEVHANPNQPRQIFDDDKLKELMKSVKEQGILQPILVRPDEGDSYQIIAGERRFRAACLCGLPEVPCIVRNLDDTATLEVALIENIQRQNLNPLEEAATYKDLLEKYNYTQSKLAEKLGKSRAYVANTIRLLSLSESLKMSIMEGRLSAGHGRALLQLTKTEDRDALAAKIAAENLSVRQAEYYAKNPREIYAAAAKQERKKQPKPQKPATVDDLVLNEVAEKLRSKLGTKVTVQGSGGKGGRIVLEYFSADDLDRLISLLLPGETF